jgi:hypothetical protein
MAVVVCSFAALLVRFSPQTIREENENFAHALQERTTLAAARA